MIVATLLLPFRVAYNPAFGVARTMNGTGGPGLARINGLPNRRTRSWRWALGLSAVG